MWRRGSHSGITLPPCCQAGAIVGLEGSQHGRSVVHFRLSRCRTLAGRVLVTVRFTEQGGVAQRRVVYLSFILAPDTAGLREATQQQTRQERQKLRSTHLAAGAAGSSAHRVLALYRRRAGCIASRLRLGNRRSRIASRSGHDATRGQQSRLCGQIRLSAAACRLSLDHDHVAPLARDPSTVDCCLPPKLIDTVVLLAAGNMKLKRLSTT